MSDSEDEIIVKKQSLKSKKLLVSDEDTDLENDVDKAILSGKPSPDKENDGHSDSGKSSCSEDRRSLRSTTSNKSSQSTQRSRKSSSSSSSSQSTHNSRKRSSSSSSRSSRSSSVSSKRSISNSSKKSVSGRSSSSESEERNKSIVGSPTSSHSQPSQKRSQDFKSQSPNSSQDLRLSLPGSQPTEFSASPTDARKPSTSDSEDDFVVSRKSNPTKLLDSDEGNSDTDAPNKSPVTAIPEGGNASETEEPDAQVPKKRRIKRRMVLDSDDEADEHNNITDKRDSETECENLTVKEKRRKKLERLNEQKMSEFAKLAKKKKLRNSKETDDESAKNKNMDQPQVENAPTKPKKFLLLSDDDLSDNDNREKPSTDEERESDEEKKPGKSTKRKKNVERKPRKKSAKQAQETDLDGEKKQRKPRQRASKSNMTLKEPKDPTRKSKKEQQAMLEIKSTTQRMIRQNRISLPYHQPKRRTLDEFLQRRNKALPSIPLRSSFDILSIAKERLMKTEEEIAEFYKSESEHSEEEQTTDVIKKCDMPPKNNEEVRPPENIATDLVSSLINSENNSSPKHNLPEVNAPNDSEPLTKAVFTAVIADNVENLNAGVSVDMQIDGILEHDDSPTNDEPITDIVSENTDPRVAVANPVKDVESGSLVNSDLNVPDDVPKKTGEDLAEMNNVQEKVDEILTENNEVHEKIDNTPTSNDEASKKVESNEDEFAPCQSTESHQRNEICPSENVDDDTPAQDTEDFQLEIQDSCPNEEKTESSIPTNTDPPARLDPETIRKKKLALLSSRSVNLSDPKLESNSDSVLQFEIEGLPEPGGIRSFMEKFARHVMAEKKTKKQPTKMSITNVQTDSEGGIIDIVQETLTLKPSNDEKNDDEPKFLLPGCKLSFFKNAMLKTLITKKTSNWQKYQDEKYSSFDKDDGECKNVDEDEEEQDTLEPNFEPYHPEDEPDDEDLLEDDIDVSENPERKKNEFLDEEAEVDFDEDENVMEGSAEEADSDNENDGDDEEKSDDENQEENCGESEKVDDRGDEDEVDSDEDLVNNVFKELEKKESMTKETRVPGNLFKNNVTGADLENKVLRLESCSQFEDFSNTQIFSVCSGKFATQTTPLKSAAASQFLTDSPFPDDSQGFNLSMEETNDGLRSSVNQSPNIVNNLRSSLLSSDESDTEELFNKKKRKVIQLEDSDDELETPNNENEDLENVNTANNDEEEEEEAEELDGELEYNSEELGYNSEEEIVDYKKTAPTEFFDNEAELSESEWGSEDENENDMDHLEKEAGDDDEIDNDRLKEELGRIHMRHLMDDDQENVRLLKELLLEDGELHSDGQRTRKFQWKNADGAFFKNFFGDSDDENVLIDDNDPNEEDKKNKTWRDMRREREKYLSQQEKNNGFLLSIEDEENSVLRVSNTTKVTTKSAIPEESTKSTLLKSPNAKFTLLTRPKCGSFLSRGQKLLSRIACNLGESKGNIQGPKNSRNFVFAAKTVEQKEVSSATTENPVEKRKISSKSVMARKRQKLVDKIIDENVPLKSGLLAQLALSE